MEDGAVPIHYRSGTIGIDARILSVFPPKLVFTFHSWKFKLVGFFSQKHV
jgi:hypothetical protein